VRYYSVPDFKGKVQTFALSSASYGKQIRYTKALQFMLEKQVRVDLFNTCVQGFFTGMPEGRVPDIMTQRYRLNKIEIQVQSLCDCSRNIVNVNYMFNTGADMVILRIEKNLCLVTQTPECLGINDSSRIAFKIRPHRTGKTCVL